MTRAKPLAAGDLTKLTRLLRVQKNCNTAYLHQQWAIHTNVIDGGEQAATPAAPPTPVDLFPPSRLWCVAAIDRHPWHPPRHLEPSLAGLYYPPRTKASAMAGGRHRRHTGGTNGARRWRIGGVRLGHKPRCGSRCQQHPPAMTAVTTARRTTGGGGGA